MALLPTLLAITAGTALGLHWGGRIDNLIAWRPPMWQALVGGVAVLVLLDLLPIGGSFAVLLRVLALGSVISFGVINMRVGGMVLVVAGTSLDFFVTVINWGMPVSTSALTSAGIVTTQQAKHLVLTGGRTADGSLLGFLGDVIPLPWGQVISIGDVLVLVGLALVVASVLRRYEVGRPSGPGRGSSGDYRSALDALGRGPAPRKGPGLHPSRLPGSGGTRRRR